MTRTLPISEVKARLPQLLTAISERGDEVVVTRNGRPAAVLVSYDEYARLKETLDVLCDAEVMEQVRLSRSFYRSRRNGRSFEAVFGEPLVPARRQPRS